MRFPNPLLLLLGTSTLALGDITGVWVLWFDDGLRNDPLNPVRDENGNALAGTSLQIGYFDGVNPNKNPQTYTAADWDSFVALTGEGTANANAVPAVYTTRIGAEGPPFEGYFNIEVTFDDEVLPVVPDSDVRIGIRFFNAAGTLMNTVSANQDTWIMAEPVPAIDLPFNKQAWMDTAFEADDLAWQGTPFITDVTPGEPPVSLVLTGVQQTGPTSLQISWTGGDGTNDIQTSTNGTDFSTVSTDQASPVTITIDPTGTTKLLVRVIEP